MAFQWFVAQAKPQSEARAARELEKQLFDAYVPKLTVRRAVSGIMKECTEPLFRGYVFVNLDLDGEEWKAVNSTKGVLNLLPRPSNPISIPTDDISGLREAEAQGLFKRGGVKVGERVKVFRGTLADQVLECVEDHGSRIRCLWACFGAPRVVDIPLSDVTVLR